MPQRKPVAPINEAFYYAYKEHMPMSIPFSADDWIKKRKPNEAPIKHSRIEDYPLEDQQRWAKCTGHIKDHDIRTLATQTKKSAFNGVVHEPEKRVDKW